MTGFDIGGTKCSVSIGEEKDGKLIIKNKKVLKTDLAASPYAMIDRLVSAALEMTEKTGPVGISCGGPLDPEKGIIMSPPNLPGWDNVTIVSYLKDKYGITSALQNDANACALAEWRFGAGRGTKNMIFLTFGTGLGAGLILDGRLYSGTNGMAGEAGHIRLAPDGPEGYGKRGSFEGFCSGGGIARLGKERARAMLADGKKPSFCPEEKDLDDITAKSIAECALKGFDDAAEIYALCGEKLGEGLAVLIDLLNPEKIVIGSVFTRSEGLLRKYMEQAIKKESLAISRSVCAVVKAELGEELGDYAALSVAADIGRK